MFIRAFVVERRSGKTNKCGARGLVVETLHSFLGIIKEKFVTFVSDENCIFLKVSVFSVAVVQSDLGVSCGQDRYAER